MHNSTPGTTDTFAAYDRPSDEELAPARQLTSQQRARAAEIRARILGIHARRQHGLAVSRPMTRNHLTSQSSRATLAIDGSHPPRSAHNACSATPENIDLFGSRLPAADSASAEHRAAMAVCAACPFGTECSFAVKAVRP
ncbi:hypothetical protein ACFWP3_09580 [Streptomyces sp. NPDC058525]|uniref:hypothetical protein n=1 Tax=Streptomyces sp. NPDC058525 TaxID=3346538 RepID=UPI00365EE72C